MIIGSSGAGKSMLVKCLLGLEDVSSGSIFFEGTLINGNEDIAFGTAIGSNISNIALIFGVSCLYLNAASKTHLSNLLPFGISILMLGLLT